MLSHSDGGAIFPHDSDARLASWAVVSDVSDASLADKHRVSEYMGRDMLSPSLCVVGCGLVPGLQSAARGELVACLHALTAAGKYDDHVPIEFVTDASYVCFMRQFS